MIWVSILEIATIVMLIIALIVAIIHDVKNWRNKKK